MASGSGRPSDGEYAPFYRDYVALVPEDDVLAALERQPEELRRLAAAVSSEGETFRYAPDKWSVRQVFGHLVDGERVFGYRAFCISRGERAPLPAFDENAYAARSEASAQALADLAGEFALVREANLAVLRRLAPAAWRLTGTASAAAVSVRALAYVMAGHLRHHLGVLRARYGVGAVVD